MVESKELPGGLELCIHDPQESVLQRLSATVRHFYDTAFPQAYPPNLDYVLAGNDEFNASTQGSRHVGLFTKTPFTAHKALARTWIMSVYARLTVPDAPGRRTDVRAGKLTLSQQDTNLYTLRFDMRCVVPADHISTDHHRHFAALLSASVREHPSFLEVEAEIQPMTGISRYASHREHLLRRILRISPDAYYPLIILGNMISSIPSASEVHRYRRNMNAQAEAHRIQKLLQPVDDYVRSPGTVLLHAPDYQETLDLLAANMHLEERGVLKL